MSNILSILLQEQEFEVIIFGDHVILEEPVDQWPHCDILIAFFSKGFPLDKAVRYVELVRPYCVNDLQMQELLFDRRAVMAILDAIDVPTAPRIVLNVDQVRLSAEVAARASRDFGIDFYVPDLGDRPTFRRDTIEHHGVVLAKPYVEKPSYSEDHNIHVYYPDGTGRRLFRKVENKASELDPTLNHTRKDDGRSYIYEQFMHMDNAEDVKVYTVGPYTAYAETRRSPSINGVVKRSPDGKELRQVTPLSDEELEMARRICMAFGQTVCGFDVLRVAGRSYVIDVNGWTFVKGSPDFAEICARELRTTFLKVTHRMKPKAAVLGDAPTGQWRLKCFLEVLRHGDRTPKLKYKLVLPGSGYAEIDALPTMEQRLDLAYRLAKDQHAQEVDAAKRAELATLLEIIERKRHLASTKVQTRPARDGQTLLIVKWGGEFTHAGRHQARDLGEATRKDLTILNRDVLNNIKVYCSQERRVQATADIFTKGLLKMAEVAPKVISVRRDLLDHASVARPSLEAVKERLSAELNESRNSEHISEMLRQFREELLEMQHRMAHNFAQTPDEELARYQWCCSESSALFRERWEKHFRDLLAADRIDPARIADLYDSLKYDALHNRDFLTTIASCARFEEDDAEKLLNGLFSKTQYLFAYLSPKEIGMTPAEKVGVGMEIVGPLVAQLVGEMRAALDPATPAKARLFFTKESHMVALLHVIAHSGIPLTRRRTLSVIFPEELTSDPLWFGELDYLSQICFELYQKEKRCPVTGDVTHMHSLRIGMSQGAHDPHILDLHLDQRHCMAVCRKVWITRYIPLEEVIAKLGDPTALYSQP